MATKKFYGIGLDFGNTQRGFFSTFADKKLVYDNLKQILLTNPGERVHLPDFGVGLDRYLFEPNDQVLADTLRDKITSQIKKYLPIVDVMSVNFNQKDNTMQIRIFYNIKDVSVAQEVFELERNLAGFPQNISH